MIPKTGSASPSSVQRREPCRRPRQLVPQQQPTGKQILSYDVLRSEMLICHAYLLRLIENDCSPGVMCGTSSGKFNLCQYVPIAFR